MPRNEAPIWSPQPRARPTKAQGPLAVGRASQPDPACPALRMGGGRPDKELSGFSHFSSSPFPLHVLAGTTAMSRVRQASTLCASPQRPAWTSSQGPAPRVTGKTAHLLLVPWVSGLGPFQEPHRASLSLPSFLWEPPLTHPPRNNFSPL